MLVWYYSKNIYMSHFSLFTKDHSIGLGLVKEVSKDGEGIRFHFFSKLKEILIRYSTIILTASKDSLISKIWRVWLKNWAHYTHLKFEVQMAANQSILELWNYQNFIELTSNMIALGVGLKCPCKIHLNSQSPPPYF